MNRRAWWRSVAAAGIVAMVLTAPAPALAQATEARGLDEEASPANVLASISAVLGSVFYAPFKAVLVCPVSAVAAGVTFLATSGAPAPATTVLHIGCEGDNFVTRAMIRGQDEFREPDLPAVQQHAVTRPSVAPAK